MNMVKSLMFPLRFARPFHCEPYRLRLFGWYLHWDAARYADGARVVVVKLFRLP